jgi:hypothetical protein
VIKIAPGKPEEPARGGQDGDHMGHPVDSDISLDLLASTAARLLVGDDYAAAAERALCLLDECAARLAERRRQRARTKEVIEKFGKRMKALAAEKPVSFTEGLKAIVGGARAGERRLRLFVFLILALYSTEAEAIHEIEVFQQRGFLPSEIERLKKEYQTRRESGELRIKRLGRKKSLQPDQTPKVTGSAEAVTATTQKDRRK